MASNKILFLVCFLISEIQCNGNDDGDNDDDSGDHDGDDTDGLQIADLCVTHHLAGRKGGGVRWVSDGEDI